MLSSSIAAFIFSKQPALMKVAMNELLGSLEGIRRSRVIRRRRTAQGHTGTPVEALTCPHIEHDGEKKAFQGRSTHVGTASAPAMCSLAILQVLHATTAHDWWGIDFLMRPRYCLIRALSQSSLIPSKMCLVTLLWHYWSWSLGWQLWSCIDKGIPLIWSTPSGEESQGTWTRREILRIHKLLRFCTCSFNPDLRAYLSFFWLEWIIWTWQVVNWIWSSSLPTLC